MPILLNSDGKIDETTRVKDKVLDERTYRSKILNVARDLGCLKEIILLFKKYDDLMRNCPNEQERKDIGKLGIIEIYKMLGSHGSLEIDGQVVIKE
jgi:hypothetical protein